MIIVTQTGRTHGFPMFVSVRVEIPLLDITFTGKVPRTNICPAIDEQWARGVIIAALENAGWKVES